MKVTLRIRRDLHSALLADLERPHATAAERVGWIFAKQASADAGRLLLFPVAYEAVADDDYVADDCVGARFNASTIRAALQRSRAMGWSCLQTHLHDHSGETSFSWTDIRTIDDLAASFRRVNPVPHGGVVLTRDSATVRVWLPEEAAPTTAHAVIVGWPMHFGPEHPC
jgi:hypothetical protein